MYTSKEFSKQLQDNGFEMESEMAYYANPYHGYVGAKYLHWKYKKEGYAMKEFSCYSYDILNDICVKYAKEFFGIGNNILEKEKNEFIIPTQILYKLQQNKTRDEIEKYIWEVCKFNPKNK